jgi:hypothetical protein
MIPLTDIFCRVSWAGFIMLAFKTRTPRISGWVYGQESE